jgi:hypothetical protein
MIRVILAVILAALLTACGTGATPTQSLVEKAIALQLCQTQKELTQQLFRKMAQPPEATVSHVKIKERRRLTIDDLSAYQVRGTYDLRLDSAKQHTTQRQNPFEVYLHPQADNTWQLARQEGDRWITEDIAE